MLPGEWSEKFEFRNRPKDYNVQSGTDETKNKALLWKPVEARKIGLKFVQPQMI